MIRMGERGISPVVGTLMMIVIVTMVVSSVAFAYMSRIHIDETPTVLLDVKLDADAYPKTLLVQHQGGESLDVKDLRLTMDGNTVYAEWDVGRLTMGTTSTVRFAAENQPEEGRFATIVYEPTNRIIYRGRLKPMALPITPYTSTAVGVRPRLTNEFVVMGDEAKMRYWTIEGKVPYIGEAPPAQYDPAYRRRVTTRITADRLELKEVYISRFNITAPSLIAESVVVYATYTEGSAFGISLSWKGEGEVSGAIGLLPRNEVTMQDLYLHVLYMEAERITAPGIKVGSELKLYAGEATLTNPWLGGPVAYSGSQVTEITAAEMDIQNLLMVKKAKHGSDGWKLAAQGVDSADGSIHATHTLLAVQLLGITGILEWERDVDVTPLAALINSAGINPLAARDMQLQTAHFGTGKATLTGVVMVPVENVAAVEGAMPKPEVVLPGPIPGRFVVTGDPTVVKNWTIKGPVPLGDKQTTLISADQLTLNGLYMSRFNLTAPSFTASLGPYEERVLMRTTFLKGELPLGSIRMKVWWSGSGEIPAGLREALGDPLTMENVYLHVVYLEAKRATIGEPVTMTPLVPAPYEENEKITITADSGCFYGNWGLSGSAYLGFETTLVKCPDGLSLNSVNTTGSERARGGSVNYRLVCSTLSSPDLMLHARCISMYNTYIMGMTVAWCGSGVPGITGYVTGRTYCQWRDLTTDALYLYAKSLTLADMKLSVS